MSGEAVRPMYPCSVFTMPPCMSATSRQSFAVGGSAAQSMVFRIRGASEVREELLAAYGEQIQLTVAERLAVRL
ncbi:hypothetical protein XACJK4_3170009 [Xanthomonas citri pv. citri]|nr:hypothetical protein XACJK4_3170009 [Xanthomonas citri pv. citri]